MVCFSYSVCQGIRGTTVSLKLMNASLTRARMGAAASTWLGITSAPAHQAPWVNIPHPHTQTSLFWVINTKHKPLLWVKTTHNALYPE